MPWGPTVAPAPRAILATAVRPQLTGADTLLPAKMEGAVAKRMLPSSVIVLMVGLDAIVTSLESPVKQLLAREDSRKMSYATVGVTVSTPGIPIIVNVLLTSREAIVKAK